jgi:hypothetical protein
VKKLASLIIVSSIAFASVTFAQKSYAYESWEIPFTQETPETYSSPYDLNHGGQAYSDDWCRGRWNKISEWQAVVYSIDNRMIYPASVNHVWYHWSNRQCVVNVTGNGSIAPDVYRPETPSEWAVRNGETGQYDPSPNTVKSNFWDWFSPDPYNNYNW